MWEFERKERHLLSGIGVQILMVGLLVFAYTQAFRQLKRERGLQIRLQEQLTMAREEVARHTATSPQLAVLETRVKEIQASWVAPDGLAVQAAQLKRLAERFQLQGVQVKVWEVPAQTLRIPMPRKEDLQVHLYPVEMTGSAGTPQVAALLGAVSREEERPLRPLADLNLRTSSEREPNPPVQFTLRWLVPVSLQSLPKPRTEQSSSARAEPWAPLKGLGWRLEPFVSPLVSPGALRIPPEELASYRLTGILWDAENPSCVLNGMVVKPGDRVGEAQVVLITREAVLLERQGQELLLRQ